MTQEMGQIQALEPLAAPDDGEARWWFGTLAVIKTAASETGGQLTIIDVTNPPGGKRRCRCTVTTRAFGSRGQRHDRRR